MWTKAIEAIRKSSPDAKVYIGCDSVRTRVKKGVWLATYSTVVVLHHPRDGCNIFHNNTEMPEYGNIKQRMLNEVGFAVAAATEVIDHLQGRTLEIHLDINTDPVYKSSSAVKEAIGWVQGTTGITPKLKPDSWCASHVSDHVVRGKLNKSKQGS